MPHKGESPPAKILVDISPPFCYERSRIYLLGLFTGGHAMADQNMTGEELLLDVRVAEASWLYKFYLNQEKKILGIASVAVFLSIWELVGGIFQLDRKSTV